MMQWMKVGHKQFHQCRRLIISSWIPLLSLLSSCHSLQIFIFFPFSSMTNSTHILSARVIRYFLSLQNEFFIAFPHLNFTFREKSYAVCVAIFTRCCIRSTAIRFWLNLPHPGPTSENVALVFSLLCGGNQQCVFITWLNWILSLWN